MRNLLASLFAAFVLFTTPIEAQMTAVPGGVHQNISVEEMRGMAVAMSERDPSFEFYAYVVFRCDYEAFAVYMYEVATEKGLIIEYTRTGMDAVDVLTEHFGERNWDAVMSSNSTTMTNHIDKTACR